MKVITLAAGEGTRLRPLTNNKPKCMVSIMRKPLLHHQFDKFEESGIPTSKQAVVGGYMYPKLELQGRRLYINSDFRTTNMVYTLFSASDFMCGNEDLLICYGDIIFEQAVLAAAIRSDAPLSVVSDRRWDELWSQRMEDPLADAETFKINKETGLVAELGKVPVAKSEVEGQFIGMVKVRADKVSAFRQEYESLLEQSEDADHFSKTMYMTEFIQRLIDVGWDVSPVHIDGGWCEIDTTDDYYFCESKLLKTGRIGI